MVFTLRPSAHLPRLATRAGLGTIFRSSDIARFVQGGVVNTFRCAATMFGRHLTCSQCSFDLLTGWNHHGPGVTVVCADCGQQIDLAGDSDSTYGPSDAPCDVRLVLPNSDDTRDPDVGPIIGAAVIHSGQLDEIFGIIPTAIDYQCPSCDSANLVGGIPEGDKCPVCKTGVISHGGSAIY